MATVAPIYTKAEEEAFYWIGLFCKHGMTFAQAEALAFTQCDKHTVVEALERGCDPSLAFDIFS